MAKYYTRVHTKRMAELLDLTEGVSILILQLENLNSYSCETDDLQKNIT